MTVAQRAEAPAGAAWSRLWRYLLAALIGVVTWFGVLATSDIVEAGGDAGDARAFVLVALDPLLGAVALALLPLRRRYPSLITVIIIALTTVSSTSVGAALFAIVSMSTRRRWRPVVVCGVVWVGGSVLSNALMQYDARAADPAAESAWVLWGLSVALYVACVSTGFYIGARRDLLSSLRERAENAEREQALRESSARESERTRIAREMHDALAHRISLVSLHAGALAYRSDLDRAQTAEAATVIQSNAQLALTELRQILGVLRTTTGDPGVEPPQPTLASLPALLVDSEEAGVEVALETTTLRDAPGGSGGLALDGLSESLSRAAFRIIQEGLTNARKHAAGAPVTLSVEREDDRLLIVIRNPCDPASRYAAEASEARGGGDGLMGLRERAELVGGILTHGVDRGGRFVVTASLPWR